MHVDTHVHVISEDEEQYPLNPSNATGPWYREDPCSVERLMTLMDDAGVDAAVLVQAISAYQHDNRYCAESARRFPERFTSVACTDRRARRRRRGAAGGQRRAHARDPLGGDVRRWVGEPRAVWDAIGELAVPVVVTILADRLEELAAAAPTLPPVPIALDHCAFADFSKGVPDTLVALAAFPRVHLKVSSNALDLMAEHGEPAEMVEELAARFGADHSDVGLGLLADPRPPVRGARRVGPQGHDQAERRRPRVVPRWHRGQHVAGAGAMTVTVLTHMGGGTVDRIRSEFPEVEVVVIEGPADLDDSVRGDVLYTTAWGGPHIEQLLTRGVRWVHTMGTGMDKFPLDLITDQTLTCSKGASGIPISEWVLAVMLAFSKNLPDSWIHTADVQWNWAELGGLYGTRSD